MLRPTLAALTLITSLFSAPPAHADGISIGINLPGGGHISFPFPGDRGPGRPGRPGGPGHGGPDYPPPPPPPGYGRDFLFQNINQVYVGQNILPLRQILNIDRSYAGRRVEFVVLRARSNRGQGMATLVINQQRVGYGQQIDFRGNEIRFAPDYYNNIIDDQIRGLQLELQGEVFVDAVGVKFAADGGYYPPGGGLQEVAVIQQNFRGDIALQLERYVDLARHRGQSLRSVILRASTGAGRGMAAFCGDRGCTPYQQVGTYMGEYRFDVYGERIDGRNDNLTLALRGDFWVDSVILQFNP